MNNAHILPSADPENRLDSLHRRDALPAYAQERLTVRDGLRRSLETQGWPVLPDDIRSSDDFFTKAKDAVAKRWMETVGPMINGRAAEWANELETFPECQAAVQLLRNPEELQARMLVQQLRPLEPIRSKRPEIWRTILELSSERQLSYIVLCRRWIQTIADDNERRKQVEESTGVTLAELSFVVDCGGTLGKYIDTGYMKQNESADAPGGSEASMISETKGAKFMYSRNNGEKVETKTYQEMFPAEFPRLSKNLRRLAQRARLECKSGALPATYDGLPTFLDDLAGVYELPTKDPATLHAAFDAMENRMQDLISSGCPVFVTPLYDPSVAGDANVADIELRVQFRPPEVKAMEHDIEPFRAVAQEWNDAHAASYSSPQSVAKQHLTLQPFAFGPNTFFLTRGEQRNAILTHLDAVSDTARRTELPRLRTLLVDGESINEQEYVEASRLDTVTHEFGHMFAKPGRDKSDAIYRRVGTGSAKNKLEEAKADTNGLRQIMTVYERGGMSDKRLRMQLIAKIGDAINYMNMTGMAGQRYYPSGIVVLHTLLENDVLVEQDGGRYSIVDPAKGMRLIVEQGDEILARHYLNDASKPEDLQSTVDEIEARRSTPKMRKFLEAALAA